MEWHLFVTLFLFSTVLAKPTVYKKNINDLYSPVLVPVSSTVIPMPIYKLDVSDDYPDSEDKQRFKLHTVKKKYTSEEKKKAQPTKSQSHDAFEEAL